WVERLRNPSSVAGEVMGFARAQPILRAGASWGEGNSSAVGMNSRLLDNRLELGEALLELAADHAVHVEDRVHDLADEGTLAGHGPGHVGAHVGARAVRSQREHDRVVALHRLEHVEPERDPRWRRDIGDLDAALSHLAVAGPFITRALAAVRAGIGDLDVGIGLGEGIPGIHAVHIVDERENLVRRSVDALRPLHLKRVSEGRRIDQQRNDRKRANAGHNTDDLKHRRLLSNIVMNYLRRVSTTWVVFAVGTCSVHSKPSLVRSMPPRRCSPAPSRTGEIARCISSISPAFKYSRMVATPPPRRISLPPAASVARLSAASIPSVTKWNVVPPAMVIDARGWCVSTKTGT